jgi:hypothetical protein
LNGKIWPDDEHLDNYHLQGIVAHNGVVLPAKSEPCCMKHFLTSPPYDQQCLPKVADGFRKILTRGIMDGCIGALDGWVCPLQSPSEKHVTNAGDYFSGHYHKYGMNVQAMCNSYCCFTYNGVMCPGRASDTSAYDGTLLKNGWKSYLVDILLLPTMPMS